MVELTPALQRIVAHWGEMGPRWGVNRTVAQVHALLMLSPDPLDAGEIASTLQVARSNVSTSLRELRRWGLVEVVPVLGVRREHFRTRDSVWEMLQLVLDERKRRELDPTRQLLRDSAQELRRTGAGTAPQAERVVQLLEVFDALGTFYEEVRQLPTARLARLLQMGRRARRLASGRG